MSKYVSAEAGQPLSIAMRITDVDGVEYVQGDLDTLSYSIVLLGEDDESDETAVVGHTAVSLTIADVVYDTLQRPASWTEDQTGYNFRHDLATSPFTLEGRVYRVRYSLVVGSATYTVDVFVTTHASRVSSGYCQRRDIEAVYGPGNTQKWADIENRGDGAHIGGRIAWAIDAATNEVNDRLRGGYYEIPFVTVPDTIRTLTAHLAGVLLYESRGIEDFDQVTGKAVHRLAWHREHVDRVLRQVVKGERRLDSDLLASNTVGCRAPVVIR